MGGRGSSSMSGGRKLDDAIRAFTGGSYSGIRAAAQAEEGSWITDDDRTYAKLLEKAVNNGSTPKNITRTVITDKVPNVGEQMEFTLSSASTRKDWATAIANESVFGMGTTTGIGDVKSQVKKPVVAYHIANQKRYVDVSNKSVYRDQKEVIFSGKYKVAKVAKETVTTRISLYDKEVRLSPQQYAKKHNMPIKAFTSKKGKEMYQIGSPGAKGSLTYPKGSTILDHYEPVLLKRDIYHVTLERSA